MALHLPRRLPLCPNFFSKHLVIKRLSHPWRRRPKYIDILQQIDPRNSTLLFRHPLYPFRSSLRAIFEAVDIYERYTIHSAGLKPALAASFVALSIQHSNVVSLSRLTSSTIIWQHASKFAPIVFMSYLCINFRCFSLNFCA